MLEVSVYSMTFSVYFCFDFFNWRRRKNCLKTSLNTWAISEVSETSHARFQSHCNDTNSSNLSQIKLLWISLYSANFIQQLQLTVEANNCINNYFQQWHKSCKLWDCSNDLDNNRTRFNWMAHIVIVETVIHRKAEESSLSALHNDTRWLNTTKPTFQLSAKQ